MSGPVFPNEEQGAEVEEDGYQSTAVPDVTAGRAAKVPEQIKLALLSSVPNSFKSPEQSISVC